MKYEKYCFRSLLKPQILLLKVQILFFNLFIILLDDSSLGNIFTIKNIILFQNDISIYLFYSSNRYVVGAGGGTRTHTPFLTTDFESAPSTNFSTPTYFVF